MTSLGTGPNSPDIEALLEAERGIFPEPDGCRERVIGRARDALASGALWERSRTSRLRWGTIGKAAAAAVVLFAICAAAFELGHRVTHAPPTAPAPAPAALEEPVAPPSPPSSSVAQQPTKEPTEEPTKDEAVAPTQRPAKAQSAPAPKPMTESDAYALELRLLRPAQQAVARRGFVKALGLVAEHQRRFPAGQLAEEREALRVKALIGLDRLDEARKAATSFREQFPHSALLERIGALLGSPR